MHFKCVQKAEYGKPSDALALYMYLTDFKNTITKLQQPEAVKCILNVLRMQKIPSQS